MNNSPPPRNVNDEGSPKMNQVKIQGITSAELTNDLIEDLGKKGTEYG
jgi:hypothetical protein